MFQKNSHYWGSFYSLLITETTAVETLYMYTNTAVEYQPIKHFEPLYRTEVVRNIPDKYGKGNISILDVLQVMRWVTAWRNITRTTIRNDMYMVVLHSNHPEDTVAVNISLQPPVE